MYRIQNNHVVAVAALAQTCPEIPDEQKDKEFTNNAETLKNK
jgi:hypothetical protein